MVRHAVDIDQAGLADLGRHDGYAERQLLGWGRQWEATRTRDLSIIEETAAALSRSVPPRREVTIAHGEYNLANLIMGGDGAVRAILDWGLCTLGDPAADLGTLLCYWPDGPDDVRTEREPVPLLPGFPRRAELVDAYAMAAPDRDLSGLRFWHALADVEAGDHSRGRNPSANGELRQLPHQRGGATGQHRSAGAIGCRPRVRLRPSKLSRQPNSTRG